MSFIDFIIIIGTSQGLFLAVTLPITKGGNKQANKVLSLLLLMACLMLVARISVFKIREDWILQLVNLADIFIFIFGPLSYLYFSNLFFNFKPNTTLNKTHYLPAGIFFIFLFYLFQFNPKEYTDRFLSGYFYYPFMIIEGSAILLNFYYCYKIKLLFEKYKESEKEQLSFNQNILLFSKIVWALVISIILVWFVSYINQYVFNIAIPLINYETIWIAISVTIYVVGFYALRQPEIFRLALQTKKTIKKNRLSQDEIELLKRQLDLLIEQKQVFLDNNLTLKKLSEKLKTSTNNLSWLLNNTYNTNFYDYINQFRIAAFLNKVHEKEHLNKTLFALSLEVGFNSKSTFNKAFKSLLNETPSNYIKNLDN